jgi:pimeloyl-ACP methyl ester carboxylesterase
VTFQCADEPHFSCFVRALREPLLRAYGPRVPAAPSIVVLHGITMSGASMLRTLGALGRGLEAAGFTLLAPNGGHRLSDAELTALSTWMSARYRDMGQLANDDFSNGRFWNAGEHYDWFQADTDAATGKKTYQALERSLGAVADAVRERNVVGVLGFSQGAAMATVVGALAANGDARFASIRWAMLLSGFKPVFDEPNLFAYPAGPLRRLLAIGELDPIFPGNAQYLAAWSRAFAGGEEELVVVPGLGHDVPSSPAVVEQLVRFARDAAKT